MIRDRWIYQKRNATIPWAVYLIATDDRLTNKTKFVAYSIYSEEIGNGYNSLDAIDVIPELVLPEIETAICDFASSYNAEDHAQLERELGEFIK